MMGMKKLLVYPIIISLLGMFIFAVAAAQTPQRLTDYVPADRPPVEREVVEAPAIPEDLLERSPGLILQDLSVVILMADAAGAEQEVADYLLASGYVMTVDAIDVLSQTPVLADIEDYDAVLTWSNGPYHDATAMGDLLADYMDLGKGVVALEFAFFDAAGYGLGGRFMLYTPFLHGANYGVDVSLDAYDADHPLMTDVSAVTEFFAVDVSLSAFGTCVAWWDNGWPFVAYNWDNNRAVGINSYVGFPDRLWTGDMLQVVLNSVLFVTGTEANVPTLSEWGMLIMGLLLLAIGTIAIVKRRNAALSRAA